MKIIVSIALLATLLLANTAFADAIDGDWCLANGRHMSINGPEIVTPHGKRMQGNYDRHAFSYVAPSGEPAAGQEINMSLIDDDLLHVMTGAKSAKPVEWRRCIAPTS
jgi:hypothetical protein